MPTLRNLSCQILWADTDAPLREYGTQYGDSVVETYVAVPDKPRRFYIRLTSNGFVHHGLAAIVFIDGTYQCNRNRVNLVFPKQGLARERSEINFVMRQKEKTIGGGLYLGRQWRFDDHNIVPDPPKMSEGDHFKFLGTIEVVVLRCCARSFSDCDASDVSSAAESQILETALSGRPSSPVDCHYTSGYVKPPGIDKAVGTEDEPLGALFGLFDGAANYPTHRYHYHERPTSQQRYSPQTCHGYHQNGHHHSSRSFVSPHAPRRPGGPAKRVHFDYGPLRFRPHSRAPSSTSEWTDDYSDITPEHPTPGNYPDDHKCSTPGLSEYRHSFHTHPFHPPPHPGYRMPLVSGYESNPSQDVPYPTIHPHYSPTPTPAHHFYMHANGWYPMSNSHSSAHLQPQNTSSLPHIAPPPLPDTQVPHCHLYPPSWVPPQYQCPHSEQKLPDEANQCKLSSVSAAAPPKSSYHSSKTSCVGSTKGTNNSSSDWSSQSYGSKDVRDGYQSQSTSDNEPSSWSTGMAVGRPEEQYCDEGVQYPDAAVGTFGENQGLHQVDESNMSATQNTTSGASNTRGATLKSMDGPYWGGVDGTPHSGTNPTNNGSANVASGIHLSAASRPLYGPHGTYFAMQSPVAPDAPCDAEEEPRYDVPDSYVANYGTTKQVQPGKGYIYTKKRYSPKYIDNLGNPYARFVFIYRTKEQLKNDLDLTLDAELTRDEEVEKLQNVSRDELIDMLIRAQNALGGKSPSASGPGVAGSGKGEGRPSEPVTFEPPDAAHLDYHIPGRWPADGTVSDAAGRGGLNDASQTKKPGDAFFNPNSEILGDERQRSWETNKVQYSEIPAFQAGNEATDNHGTSWANDYQVPVLQAVNSTTNNQATSWGTGYQAPTVETVNDKTNNQGASWSNNYQAPSVETVNENPNNQAASWSNNYQAPSVENVNDTADNQNLSWSTNYQAQTQNGDHQSRKSTENDGTGAPSQQINWQSNVTTNEEWLDRQGPTRSTQDPSQGHAAGPEREFSAPLVTVETEEPTQEAKGGQIPLPPPPPPPPPLPTSHGRWILSPQGWLWQLPAYSRPEPPAYFGYGPCPPFYGPPSGHHYQQYLSVRPAPEPRPVHLSQQTRPTYTPPTSAPVGGYRRAKDSATQPSLPPHQRRDQGSGTSLRQTQNINQDGMHGNRDLPQQRAQNGWSSGNWSSQDNSEQTQPWQDQQQSMGEAPQPEGGW